MTPWEDTEGKARHLFAYTGRRGEDGVSTAEYCTKTTWGGGEEKGWIENIGQTLY